MRGTKSKSKESASNKKTGGRHLVITVHGIRTYGDWQDRFENLVVSELGRENVEFDNYKYDFFSIVAFILPLLRWLEVRKFRTYLLRQAKKENWARIDLVGHSFGTHILAWALHGIPQGQRPRIHTILLTGSVLKQGFPWAELEGCVRRVANDCGSKDDVLLYNQLFVFGTGMAGRVGFVGGNNASFRNRFHILGHSGYFRTESDPRSDDWMSRFWLPLITDEGPINGHDERTPPTTLEGIVNVIARYLEPIKLALLVSPLVLGLIWITGLYLEADKQARLALSRQLAAQAQNQLGTDLPLAILLSIEASNTYKTTDARTSLLKSVNINRQLISLHKQHSKIVTSVDLSSNGKILASGSWDGSVLINSIENQENVSRINLGEDFRVTSADFSPDHSILAIGGADRLLLWDLNSKNFRETPSQSGIGEIESLAFSPDGTRLAIGGAGIVLWDLQRNEIVERLHPAGKGTVSRIEYSLDGEWLAALRCVKVGFDCLSGGSVYTWSFAENKPRSQILPSIIGPLGDIALSPNSGTLAVAEGLAVRFWDLEKSRWHGRRISGGEAVTSIAYSPLGGRLAVATRKFEGDYVRGRGRLALYDVLTNYQIGTMLDNHLGGVFDIAFSLDGSAMAAGTEGGAILIWDLNVGSIVGSKLFSKIGGITDANFKPGSKSLLVAQINEIAVWDTEKEGKLEEIFRSDRQGLWSTALSSNGEYYAFGGIDGRVRLWSIESKKLLNLPIRAPLQKVTDLSFSRDGELLAWGSLDKTVRVWSVKEERYYLKKMMGTEIPNSISINPSGAILAIGSFGGEIKLWDLKVKRPLPALVGHDGPVRSLAFSPNGKILASGGNDKTIRFWDIETTRSLGRPVHNHKGAIGAVAFSPDGMTLAAGVCSLDVAISDCVQGSIILVDVDSHYPWGRLLGSHSSSVDSLSYSSDGKLLVSVSGSANGALWNVGYDELRERACRLANRNLTYSEWKYYVGNAPYRRTCPEFTLPEE